MNLEEHKDVMFNHVIAFIRQSVDLLDCFEQGLTVDDLDDLGSEAADLRREALNLVNTAEGLRQRMVDEG